LEIVLQLAEGKIDMPIFAEWLPIKGGQKTIEPNSERDMQIIEALITQHRWLLDELAER
jgi:hypothetical protein